VARHRVAGTGDLAPGELKRVEIGDVALCLAHVKDGGFCAVADLCTHEEIELSDGYLDGGEIV